MKQLLRKIAGVRLGIAIQVFTTLLILAVGFFAVEGNLRDLARSRNPISPYELKMALLTIRAQVLIVAFVAFVSGLVLTFTIRREVKRAIQGVERISRGVLEADIPRDLSQEFIPLDSAIQKLGESLGRFFQHSITDAIVLVRDDCAIEFINPAAEVLLGRRSEELSGKSLSVLFPEGEANRDLHLWLRGNETQSETEGPRIGSVLTGKGEWITVRLSTFQIYSGAKRLRGIVAGFFDMEEWQRIREEFDRANRLSTLGLLVSGLAHEIKNPLGSIFGLVQMLGEGVPADHPNKKYYETILSEVRRLDEIMKRLLDLAAPAQWEMREISLRDVVDDVSIVLEPAVKDRGVRLAGEIVGKVPLVVADFDRVKQAVLNVMKNSIEATPRGMTVTWNLEVEDPWVVLAVKNPGAAFPDGIPAQGPSAFFSTKVQGSGLGLAITHQILHHLGGRLLIKNQREGGVVIRLLFPLEHPRNERSGLPEHGRFSRHQGDFGGGEKKG